jgi:hypothetical protein
MPHGISKTKNGKNPDYILRSLATAGKNIFEQVVETIPD